MQARSQEARSNWEAALESKDRAIGQLEEALSARQRTIEQLNRQIAAGTPADAALEASLAEAQVGSLSCDATALARCTDPKFEVDVEKIRVLSAR
jgi:septal ring factor EnvC (AmiA/AmiB activator)